MTPMSRRTFLLGSAGALALAQMKTAALAEALDKTGLKDAYKNDFLIGTAISNGTLASNDQVILELIRREFNAITAENCMKSGLIQPRQGQWEWELADRFMDFGSENNMTIVGHALVWHSQAPQDFFVHPDGSRISRAELTKRMETHISTLMQRYKGRVHIWDVVNEAIDEDQGWRRSPFHQIMGPEYMEYAFHLAHELDANAHLMYNDYNMHNPGKREFLVNILRDYRKRGVPIHGVGLQGHVGLDWPDLGEFEKSIVTHAAEGMRIHVTELDVDVLPVAWDYMGAEISTEFEYSEQLNPWPDGLPTEIEQRLTARYVELFELFLKHRDKIDRITTWGTHDGESWKNDFPVRGRTNYPLLFDRNLQPKPAHQALLTLRS